MSKADLIDANRLLSRRDVLEMLPITEEYLSRLTNHPSESQRIPSFKIGRRVFYVFEEIKFYIDNHRYTPQRKSRKKALSA